MDSNAPKIKFSEMPSKSDNDKHSARLRIKMRRAPGGGAVLQVGFLPAYKSTLKTPKKI